MSAWLKASGVGFSYSAGTNEVLAEISFELGERERIVAVVGPDGAGKSTLMKLFIGLLAPTSGELLVGGVPPDTENEAFVDRIGFMPQTFGLYKELSCMENLRLFSELARQGEKPDEVSLRNVLKLTGLAGFENRPAGALSGGMKQKLALAATLVSTPEMLFLDEPTVGVDPLSRAELWHTVEARVAAGQKCVFSTASPEEAGRADRILLMKQGRILANLTPGELSSLASERTFSMHTASLSGFDRQCFERRLMRLVSAAVPESPFLDVVPKNGVLNLLTVEAAAPDMLNAWLAAEAPALGISTEWLIRVGVPQPRLPTIEDGYAAATFEQFSPSAWEEQNAASHAPLISPDAKHEDVVIRADGMSRRFGDFVAVADTSFTVRRGEIFGLLGPNGAGKTTTFRMLCGLLPSSSGRTETAGHDLRTAKSEARAEIGYVAQRFSLYERLSVEANLKYFGRSYGFWGKTLLKRIVEVARSFGLLKFLKHRAGELSEGGRRELAMAAALLHAPKVLFLDEATSGADLAARRAFWRRIVTLAEAGVTIVVTTHFMEEAEYCDRFLIQDAGKILVMGSPAEVRAVAAKFPASNAAASAERFEGDLSMEEVFIRIVQAGRRERELPTKGASS